MNTEITRPLQIWRIPNTNSREFEVVDIGDDDHEPSTLMIGTQAACQQEYPGAVYAR